MAIKIKKPTKYADTIEAEYWVVGIANIHPISKSCSVVIFGYLNKAAYTAKKEFLDKKEISVPWSAFSNEKNPSFKDIEAYLKSTDDWKDGVDD